MKKNNKKRFKLNFIKVVLFLTVLWSVLYIPLKVKHFSLIKREVSAGERFNENLEAIQDFKYIKDSYNNLYSDDEELKKISDSISYIEGKLSNKISDELENLISELKSKVNDLSAANERELEEYFNSINDSGLNNFNEDEIAEVNNLINEYNNLFKEKNYKQAKSKLDELSNYINETKKNVNLRSINEKYEEKSSEDASLREPTYINGILIANKEYGLPDDFAPGESAEAREAFEEMKTDAAKEGIYLNAFSTYRSYWSQYTLYNNYVSNYGQDSADTFSAKPGFSEHQTGLAFDIGGVDRSLWAEEDFKYTDEAKWLKENCTKYGFILRYPEGKEWITGYMYESWHFRYIGVENSKNFENSDLTLEEYLGLE
ncbi:M15 family metallopeptidase [Clostridium nigeriense]|uniref:M15 family metallopeptidase n=1 Tax=Clostridium nigeriense TaxID=1805470 RepID=UPI003D337A10